MPIVQITVPAGADPVACMAVGHALGGLREQGILLVAAGALIHNLRLVRLDARTEKPDDWAEAFGAWVAERLADDRLDEIIRYRELAPGVRLAAPTSEHFDPLFFALGAADGDSASWRYRAIRYGNDLLAIFTFGATESAKR